MTKQQNKEIFKYVKKIDLVIGKKITSLFAGNYRSVFKGQGMVFSDFREYIPGDDVRSISWNMTAKMSKPYIKTFEEDKDVQIILAIDVSSSMDFGTGRRSKKQATNLLSSVIAFCSQKNNHALGLLLFSSDIEFYIPPKSGLQQTSRIIQEIYTSKRKSKKTDFNKSFTFLSKILKKRSHIFICSDFLSSDSFEKAIQKLKKRHDVINIIFYDPLEQNIPALGLVDIEDIETGKQRIVDFSSHFFQKKLKLSLYQKNKQRYKQLIRARCEQIFIDCTKDIYSPLVKFFQKRIRKTTYLNK